MNDFTLLNFLGMDYDDRGENVRTECLWCGHRENCEVSVERPHQFQCWSCKHSGNGYSLLQKWYDRIPALTPLQGKQLATMKPGTKPTVYRTVGVRIHESGPVWPVKNTEGKVVALYRFSESNNTWYSTPKPFALTLLNLQFFKSAGKIWMPEGHWDVAAWMSYTKTKPLGLCGSSFPSKHLGLLEGREVVFLADNDKAGMDGVTNLAKKMKSRSLLPARLMYLNWEVVSTPVRDNCPDGFDTRDLICDLEGIKI